MNVEIESGEEQAMIRITRHDNMKIQVLDDELLLASFSEMEAAVDYARATQMKMRKNFPNEPSRSAA